MRRVVIAAGMIAVMTMALSACSAMEPGIDPAALDVSVSAELSETDAPFSVSVSEIRADDGVYRHEVLVTLEGDTGVVLDDARFTHGVPDEDGELLLAGRGCRWNWSEEREELAANCTADLMIIEVAPGDTHEYPLVIQPEVGPARLAPGSYELEEEIAWGKVDDLGPREVPGASSSETFTVRLTYVVREFPPANYE